MQPNSAWNPGQREQQLQQLKQQPEVWDMVIAGGGITAAGIAREAARRGLKVLLLERQDFAWGTSSRSSKMVHGGLRYIASGDIKTTMHSVQERERLMQEVPGLVDRMGYLMAHYQGRFPGPLAFNTLLRIYDFFAGKRYRHFFNSDNFHWLSPNVRDDKLLGGTQFADAVTDDSRLVVRVLREAQQDGARALNYVGGKSLIKQAGQVCGLVAEDTLSGEVFEIRAQVVINATGAWADELRGQLVREKHIRPARGSHIVVPAWRLPVAQSFTVLHPLDQRPVFIFPWEGRSVIGTTDLDNNGIENHEVSMTRKELEYLLEAVRYQFPQVNIHESDIISSWAGVRPLVSSGARNPSKEKRDHSIWDDNGLVSVSGGKLTTFRLIALDVLTAAQKYIANYPAGKFSQQIFSSPDCLPLSGDLSLLDSVPDYLHQRLRGHFGMDLPALLSMANADELEPVPGTRTLWAELRWAAARESVIHLDDVLLRRTRLGLLLQQGGLLYAERIKAICCAELGWDDMRWQEEFRRYQSIWTQYYSLPAI